MEEEGEGGSDDREVERSEEVEKEDDGEEGRNYGQGGGGGESVFFALFGRHEWWEHVQLSRTRS